MARGYQAVTTKLRVGVLLDSPDLRAWQSVLLRRIETSDTAELALIVVRDSRGDVGVKTEPSARATTVLQSLAARVVEATYRRLERRIYCEHDAFALGDVKVLAGIPRIDAGFDGTNDTAVYADEDIARIRGLQLDALLELGSGAASRALGSAARFGVWYLDSTDYPRRSGAPPGFWEVYFGQPTTRMVLTAVLGNGRNHPLAVLSAGTHTLSVKLNRSKAYWNALSLVLRKLEDLSKRGNSMFCAQSTLSPPPAAARTLEPDVRSMALYVLRNVKRRAGERLKRTLGIEQWILLYHLGDELCTDIAQFQSIVPPVDRYWADPHIVQREDRYYVFVEEFVLATNRGRISVITIDKDGTHGAPVTVLERPYHLSYPFVFEHAGDLYMVPESMENKTIQLYRCVEFPSKWTFVRNLLDDVWAVDPTLLRRDGKWWLFATVLENAGGSPSEELFLFHSDCLLTGRWTPHVLNPLVADVTTARPAGAIQERDGKLYRPAQDCSVRYGYAIRINEIENLSTEDYSEKEVAVIEPDWNQRILGMHTLAHVPGLTVVDALLDRKRFGQHRRSP